MSSKEPPPFRHGDPSLEDLGLEAPVDFAAKKKISIADLQAESELEREELQIRSMKKSSTPNDDSETATSIAAAACSVLLPGVGHMIKGRLLTAIGWFFATIASYVIWPWLGLLVHILCIVHAAQVKRAG